LIRWLGRAPPEPMLFDPPHVMRVVVPWIGVEGMLDTALEQIRHYAVTDLAVSLRLLRAIGDIAGTVQRAEIRAALLARARCVVAEAARQFREADAERLRQRLAIPEERLGDGGLTG
jgi:uncharacterized membrane protein